jgi:hypothetical protein
MKASIKDKNLVIEIPLQKPQRSATGKTLLVASSHGVQQSTAHVNGKQISFVANAFIYPDDVGGTKASKKSRNAEEVQDDEEDED